MGPWSDAFLAAVAGNAERPELEVTDLRIEPGVISARVDGCAVSMTASVVPARTWESITRFARGMGPLQEAVEGRIQSAHLEHLLDEDWGERLIPSASAVWQDCSCDEQRGCVHRVAVAFAVADEIERSPLALLRWRGAGSNEAARAVADPWHGRELPPLAAPRQMPVDAVLKRLGRADVQELPETLRPAYERLRTIEP